ncbi:MAG: hypothetical protein J6R99_00510 [Alphaproteobacteria bacterium]|nr:hypothetical protein [Alphaproteobacteria bacterium]
MANYIISEQDMQNLQDKISNIEVIVSRCNGCSKLLPDVNRIKVLLEKMQNQKMR